MNDIELLYFRHLMKQKPKGYLVETPDEFRWNAIKFAMEQRLK